MKPLPTFALIMIIAGCGNSEQTTSTPPVNQDAETNHQIKLDDHQKAMLIRVTELLKEAKQWRDMPLASVKYNNERKQWEYLFSDMKPDSGIAAYIVDKNSTEIDILLFPPMWTKYKRIK